MLVVCQSITVLMWHTIVVLGAAMRCVRVRCVFTPWQSPTTGVGSLPQHLTVKNQTEEMALLSCLDVKFFQDK